MCTNMDDIPSTFPNTTWPWALLSILTVYGIFAGAVLFVTLVTFPWTPKLFGFDLFTTVSVLLLSLVLAAARSSGAPKRITFHTWGISGTISYPRWTGRGVRHFSVPYQSIHHVTRWLPGWGVSTEIPARSVRGRLYVTVSSANAVRIRLAWEHWKTSTTASDGRCGSSPSGS